MNLHKITLYVVDFEELGAEGIINEVERSKYYMVARTKSETADIGEWDDDHVLNYNTTSLKEYEKYFKCKCCGRVKE